MSTLIFSIGSSDTSVFPDQDLVYQIDEVLSLGKLNHLQDVNLEGTSPSLANNHFLVYDSANIEWVHKQPSDALISLGVTSSASELNKLDGTTVSATQINYLDVSILGTLQADKVLTANSDGDLIVPDSDKFQFGDGLDMTLYHDGTDSYITNQTGALKIATETSGIAVQIGHSTSEVTIGDNLVVTGNLIVNGQTTTVNSTVTTIDDPIMTLGGNTAPGSDDNKDRGIEFRYHNGSAAKVGFFGFDDSTSKFTFIPDATNSTEVFSGSAGDVSFGGGEFSDHVTLSNAKTLRLSETDANGSHYIALKAPDSVSTDTTLTLPDGAGTNGQVLTTSGASGVLTWSNATGGVTSSSITGQTEKTTINDNDLLLIADSQDSNNLKKVKRSKLVEGLSTNNTYSAKTANFSAQLNYHYSVNTTGGAVTVSLPEITNSNAGKSLVIKFRNGLNVLTVSPYSGDTIEGLNSLNLTNSEAPGQSLTLVSDGTSAWEIT